MFLHIADTMSIADVQERFAECFPFLKIEFYSQTHKRFAETESGYQIPPPTPLADVRSRHANGVLEIKSWHTVAKVEKELKDLFGLNAQVFRTGPDGSWIQTSLSDNLTLQEQSEIAMRTK